jgi:hypothetical protein
MECLKKSHGFWQNRLNLGVNPRVLRTFVFLCVSLLGSTPGWICSEARASGEGSDEISESTGRGNYSDEYNFNWLDPEKKIYVLQNRKYVKTGHPILSVLGGGSMSNSYRTIMNVDGRLAYYMSEWLGVEFFYSQMYNSPNNVIQALGIASPNALPSVREIRGQAGGMVHFVPWYAKINVFNSILYFDWYFGAGLASVSSFVDTRTNVSARSTYTQQNLIGFVLSTGHEYYLSQSFIFRLDCTGVFYNAPINGLSGDSSWYSNITFAAGLGWRL